MGVGEGEGGHRHDNTAALSSCHSSPRWAGAILDPVPKALEGIGERWRGREGWGANRDTTKPKVYDPNQSTFLQYHSFPHRMPFFFFFSCFLKDELCLLLSGAKLN